MAAVQRALLFVNLHKENATALADEIRADLAGRGVLVRSFTFEEEGTFARDDAYDVAFSLGGDGTVLYTARAMAARSVPIIPINLGTLGFIATVRSDTWRTVLGQVEAGVALVSRRFMLEVAVERRGTRTNLGPCLNDVVISALGIAKIIRLKVESVVPPSTESRDTEFLRLGEYRSDGLIIATPTGSTGYSVAAGGPILEPEMEAIIINPICPFTLSNRPIVLSPRETVIVTVEQEQRSGVLLTIDGQVTEALEPGDRVHVHEAPFPAMLVASGRQAFYEALRTKLAWSIPGSVTAWQPAQRQAGG
jgi:NAD+ kinase